MSRTNLVPPSSIDLNQMVARELFPHFVKDAQEQYYRWRPAKPLGAGVGPNEEGLWIRYEDPYAVRITVTGDVWAVELFRVRDKRLLDVDPDQILPSETVQEIVWKFDLKSLQQ